MTEPRKERGGLDEVPTNQAADGGCERRPDYGVRSPASTSESRTGWSLVVVGNDLTQSDKWIDAGYGRVETAATPTFGAASMCASVAFIHSFTTDADVGDVSGVRRAPTMGRDGAASFCGIHRLQALEHEIGACCYGALVDGRSRFVPFRQDASIAHARSRLTLRGCRATSMSPATRRWTAPGPRGCHRR